jgi:GDSL-like Lipase/Acylhydrolase family
LLIPVFNYTVALGDSYSSGLGNTTCYEKAPCWRSYGAYAWQLSLDLALDITDFEACAGATTSSVLHDQVKGSHVGGLSVSTGVVTLSVGGNDADFIGILGRCLVAKSWCENQLRKERGVIRNHGATDLLDDTIRAATQRNHVYFVDPRAAFTGHSECDKDAWINHFYGGEPQVCFHPSPAGWSVDANLIEKLLWRIGW